MIKYKRYCTYDGCDKFLPVEEMVQIDFGDWACQEHVEEVKEQCAAVEVKA